ncbi:lipase [Corynebacterium sp. LK32]|uniref:lipase family protein n=1 Tax=unclassified Corynebacterium TaxID=2624378 RepID=UPI0008A5A18F|nr:MULTISPECIES: lipase family protein [unclassified Corynebacterium]MBC6829944.1 lipase [Corynebacterium sp. LK32]OFM51236.1 lipase [Corynebacterium sp. HMSC064H12]OFQ02488.1 lipase [Corynebacterium sp. HMSC070B05]
MPHHDAEALTHEAHDTVGTGRASTQTRSASRRNRRTIRTGIGVALAGLMTIGLATPANAQPLNIPGLSDSGLADKVSSSSANRELPGFGHVPNPNMERLLGIEKDDEESGSEGAGRQLTPEQARVAAASPLNSLPLTPSRTANAGTLVSSEDAEMMVNDKLWNVDAKRIHYNSTDSLGNPSVDTALVVTPKTVWKGSGPRPVVAIAPGTQGGAEKCDPSISSQTGLKIEFGPLDIIAPYETIPMVANLKRGATVVMIDHHRNSQGNQDYVDNIASAQSLFDAVSASHELGVDKNAPVGIYGYSQGGSAAAAAAERAGVYAPELNVAASAAGGPPSDLANVLDQIDGTTLTAAIALAINSVLDKDPELRRVLKEEISPEGKELLDNVGNYCAGGLGFHHSFETTDQYTTSGESLSEMIKRYEPVQKELARQRVGNFVPNAPVYLYSGEHDDIIPINQVRKLRDSWLNLGFTDLEYVENTTSPVLPKTGINHIVPMLAELTNATDFLWSHFPDQPAEQSLEL